MTGVATDIGVADVVSTLVAGNTPYLGWGSGSGQGETDTDLDASLPENRASGSGTAVTTNSTGDTYRLTGTITASAARAVTEVGVFSAATGDVMQLYGDFPVVNLAAGDSIAFTIDVVVDQA